MLKLVGISFGAPLFVVGFGGMIFAIHGLIDPAGAQLSDDSNPFGVPASLSHSLVVLTTKFSTRRRRLAGVVGKGVRYQRAASRVSLRSKTAEDHRRRSRGHDS
jgi:hypothetical protein